MTRAEFDNITCFGELFDVAREFGYYFDGVDIYDQDELDNIVTEYINQGGWEHWEGLLDILNNVPQNSSSGYYSGTHDQWDIDIDEIHDYEFNDYYDELYDWLSDNELFDDDNDLPGEDVEPVESYDNEAPDDDDDAPVEIEDISICDLMSICHNQMKSIST